MNATELLNKIKAIFNEVTPVEPAPAPVVEPAPVEFKDYTLADGTSVSIDKLEVGGAVTKDGAPAPEGEYKMADGSAIEVDASGLIAEIKAAEPAAPEVIEPAAPVVMEDARVTALMAEQVQIKQAFKDLVALVEGLIETPAAEPIEPQRTRFGMEVDNKKERLSNITKLLTKIKNK
jgi:hypothetical protein